jgi:hypothetical protein
MESAMSPRDISAPRDGQSASGRTRTVLDIGRPPTASTNRSAKPIAKPRDIDTPTVLAARPNPNKNTKSVFIKT